LEVINEVSCRLDLPPQWKMHPVVHASCLIPYRDGSAQFPDREPPPPDPEVEDGEAFWSVEAFVRHVFKGGQRRKLHWVVKWTGYGPEHNTTEPASELRQDLGQEVYERLVEDYRVRAGLSANFLSRR
jgi:hypothetical protein